MEYIVFHHLIDLISPFPAMNCPLSALCFRPDSLQTITLRLQQGKKKWNTKQGCTEQRTWFLNYQGVQLFTEPKQRFSQLKQQKPQNTSYVDGIRVTFNSYFTNVLQ